MIVRCHRPTQPRCHSHVLSSHQRLKCFLAKVGVTNAINFQERKRKGNNILVMHFCDWSIALNIVGRIGGSKLIEPPKKAGLLKTLSQKIPSIVLLMLRAPTAKVVEKIGPAKIALG